MWIKLCLLLLYICLLFLLSRLLETISWCDLGSSNVLSRQLLDPMRLSVAKLKCLLDNRGVSYDGIVEKSELTGLVEASGPINEEDLHMACHEETPQRETNFTCGAHFIEQVEDAKDSVWLVQVVTNTAQVELVMNRRWRNVQRKVSEFGVRTGLLDCSLDYRYCNRKGWKVPILLLALPSHFEKKANVIMYNYSGPVTESAIMRWIHDKLDERIMRVKDVSTLQNYRDSVLHGLQPELKAILFTQAVSAPLFFSSLSVKFPGRVKFGLVPIEDSKKKKSFLKSLYRKYNFAHLPMCVIYTAEKNYTYGFRPSEKLSFSNMEIFLKFLYPCLNDIFIISFCVANVISWFEFFVSNCGLLKRVTKLIWCVFKYNLIVIMLWLPVIGIFQMPYLDQVPLLLLKLHRMFTMSGVGAVLRGDYVFFVNNPIYVYMSFVGYLVVVTLLCRKYREVEEDVDDWFNFRQMQTLTHLRANNLFEPMRMSSYDLVGGFEVFGSRFSQHSLWLQPSIPLEYIQHLPTWRYTPQSMASRAAQNASKVESSIVTAETSHSSCETKSVLQQDSQKVGTVPRESAASQNCLSSRLPDDVQFTDSFAANEVQPCTSRVEPNTTGAVSKLEISQETNNHPENSRMAPCEHFPQHHPTPLTVHEQNDIHPCGILSTDLIYSDVSNNQPHPPTNDPRQDVPSPSTQGQERSIRSLMQPEILPSGFRRGFMESLQCVICLDDYVPLTMLCGLPCGHVFHETCIISWLNREKHFCPMCRWPSYKLVTSQDPS